jgi:release factor glutamine methyltransferase
VNVSHALRAAEERLARAGVESPRVDAELLLAHALGGVSRAALYAAPERAAPDAFEPLLARREAREPLAYVLGEWGFRRLTLTTDRRALVPRPETEVVVERCLALLAGLDRPRVLDVGVGTGAIALAIADEHPGARVTAVDVSDQALSLAVENVRRTGLPVELRRGGMEVAAEGWDLVVSNPPYVAPEELDALEPEIRDWEPRLALVGDGFQEELARAARTARLVLEVAPRQAARVARTLAGCGYDAVTITRDLAGKERVVEGTRA